MSVTFTERAAPLRLWAVRKSVVSRWLRSWGLGFFSRANRSWLSVRTCSSSSSRKVAIRRFMSLVLSMSHSLFCGHQSGSGLFRRHVGQPGAEGVQIFRRLGRLLGRHRILLGHVVD